MSLELKAKLKWCWEEAFNYGNIDVLDQILAPDYIRHKPPFPDIVSLEAEKKFIQASRDSYPDVRLTIDQLIVDDNWTAWLWTFSGTQKGVSPTTGALPQHKHITFHGCEMSRLEGGKIVETWEIGDYLGLLQQLGAVARFG